MWRNEQRGDGDGERGVEPDGFWGGGNPGAFGRGDADDRVVGVGGAVEQKDLGGERCCEA